MRSAYSKAFARLAFPLLLAATQGCSGDKEHLQKQLSKLEDEVRHLQSETDRMGERLDAVETRNATASHYAEDRVAVNNGATVTRPKLKVVRVEPGDDEVADDAPAADAPAPDAPEADNGPRVLIQGEGKSIESRTLPGTAPAGAKTTPPSTKPPKGDAKVNKAEAPSSK